MSDLDRLTRAYQNQEPESRREREDTYGLTTNSPGLDRLESAYRTQRFVQSPEQQRRDRPFYQKAFLGGVRGIAGALEPIQLAKDPFDAIVAGALDPETSITERLSRLEWQNYIPFGEAPPRAATGHEIMDLMGVEDERAKRWGGVVFDLTADPLLAGAWLRLGAAATRSQSLARTGRQLDEAISLRALNQGASRVIPGKRWVDRRAEETFDRFLNARVFWSKAEEPLTYGDYVMTRTGALSRQFPGSERVAGDAWEVTRDATGRWISRNRETGAVVQNFGRELWRTQGVARQQAREVTNRSLDLLEEAQSGVLGDQSVPFLERAARIIGRGRARAERAGIGIPANVRDTIYAQGYDVADNIGIAARGMRAEAPSALKREFGLQVGRMTDDQERVLRQARSRVAKSAKDSGFDVDEAIRRFDTFTEKITEADALLGFHLSGYNNVKRLFEEEMFRAGIGDLQDVRNMWTDVIQRGMGGEDIMSARQVGGIDLEDAFRNVESLTGRKVSKLGDIIKPEVGMRGLNLNDYLRNLREGHLRRSYGLFQSPTSFRNYIEQVRTGRVLPSNIIDQSHARNAFGPDTPELDAFTRYMDGVGGIEGRGVVVRQSNLMEGIRDQLVERYGIGRREASRRAQESVGNLVKEMQAGGADSPISKLVDNVMDMASRYEQPPSQAVRPGMGQSMFKQRQDLEQATLETLGELAMPQVSIRETARAARSQVAYQDFMSGLYREARRQGYVTTDDAFRKGSKFRRVQDTEEVYGPFAGKFVHPMLKKELHRAWRDRAARGGSNFSRLRSLVTGGYLASPNVITANLFGGVYTTALLGISPVRMFRELADSFKSFRRASKDVNFSFDELDDLKRWQAVDDQTLIDANIDEVLRRAGATRDMGPQGIQRVFDEATRRFQGVLDAPLGQQWAGLEGFQFVENWMKVSAFKAQRRILANQRGVSMDEFKRAFADRSKAAQIIDKEASEVARIAVFDYSDIPESVRLLRDSGLMLFPSFPYFLTARTARAAFERPGVLAASDRLSDAINSAQMDEETKRAVFASMPEWLQDEQGVVFPFRSWEDEEGNTRRSVIPFNQLVPTSTLMGNPWGESLSSVGIYKPFVEMGSAAFITKDGEAPFSAQFGQRVYEQGLPAGAQAAQAMGFLTNSLAPGLFRKMAGYTPGEGFHGILPTMRDMAVPMDGPLADSIYNVWEVENKRAQRTLWDQVVASTARSPQVITLEGPLANIRKNIAASQFELEEETRTLSNRRDRALMRGNRQLAETLQRRIDRKRREWAMRLRPALEAVREGTQGEE